MVRWATFYLKDFAVRFVCDFSKLDAVSIPWNKFCIDLAIELQCKGLNVCNTPLVHRLYCINHYLVRSLCIVRRSESVNCR